MTRRAGGRATPTREQALARLEAATTVRRKRYWQRVLYRRCVYCNAGLTEDDGVRCVECCEARVQARTKQRKDGLIQERAAAWMRAWRKKQRQRGLCRDCSNPAQPGAGACAEHLQDRKLQQLRYLDRRDARRAA